jgi:hypothetical protein
VTFLDDLRHTTPGVFGDEPPRENAGASRTARIAPVVSRGIVDAPSDIEVFMNCRWLPVPLVGTVGCVNSTLRRYQPTPTPRPLIAK